MTAAGIVQAVPTWLERYSTVNEHNGIAYNAPPWVVFDTASAVIELGNENDNSEVSAAVATLKQQLFAPSALPLLIIGHVAKASASFVAPTRLYASHIAIGRHTAEADPYFIFGRGYAGTIIGRGDCRTVA